MDHLFTSGVFLIYGHQCTPIQSVRYHSPTNLLLFPQILQEGLEGTTVSGDVLFLLFRSSLTRETRSSPYGKRL